MGRLLKFTLYALYFGRALVESKEPLAVPAEELVRGRVNRDVVDAAAALAGDARDLLGGPTGAGGKHASGTSLGVQLLLEPPSEGLVGPFLVELLRSLLSVHRWDGGDGIRR